MPLTEPIVVVIPCRNEAQRLPATLAPLLAAADANLHVVIVDDHSDDATAAVISAAMAKDRRVSTCSPAEPGKAMALAAGFAVAEQRCHGSLVLCLDADVVLAPGGVGGLAALYRSLGVDVLSGLPALDLVGASEQMLIPAFVAATAAHHPPERTMDKRSRAAFLNGQVIVTTADVCARAGGWSAVADQVLEDVAFARRVKASGHSIALCDLRLLARTRMYTSRREIFAGFGKNAKALFGVQGLVLNIAVAMWLCSPWLVAIAAGVRGHSTVAVVAILVVVVITSAQGLLRRTVGWPVWPVWLLPLIYASVIRVCAVALVRRRVRWRGRTWLA